jgi:hypothetical protein
LSVNGQKITAKAFSKWACGSGKPHAFFVFFSHYSC